MFGWLSLLGEVVMWILYVDCEGLLIVYLSSGVVGLIVSGFVWCLIVSVFGVVVSVGVVYIVVVVKMVVFY